MNTYRVLIRWTENFSEERIIKADFLDYTDDHLRFYMDKTYETVALFAKGTWASVVKVS